MRSENDVRRLGCRGKTGEACSRVSLSRPVILGQNSDGHAGISGKALPDFSHAIMAFIVIDPDRHGTALKRTDRKDERQ